MAAHARLLRIEDTRRDEPAVLDSLLKDQEALTRGRAALTAGRLGDSVHAPRLRILAADTDTSVAANALFALGLMKDRAALTIASSALRGPVVPAREAAWLLGELGDAGRISIDAGLRDETLSAGAHAALLLAAARLRPIPIAAVVPWLASPDSELAWRAAYAIARGRASGGLRALLLRSTSPWVAVREQVARGASRAMAGDSLGTEAAQILAILARDASARVRVNAIRSLATYGPSTRVQILGALADSDVNVRVAAAQSLEPVIGADTVTWCAAFDADTTFIVRRSLAEGAVRRNIDLAARADWAESRDWQPRAVAVALGGRGRADVALRRVSGALGDPDGRVRAIGIEALTPLLDSASTRDAVRMRLKSALADSDVGVRANSLGALRRGASAEDLVPAVRSYRRFLADSDNDARLAFWHLADSAMSRAGTSLPDSIRRELVALPRPVDPLERAAASAIPAFSAWKDGTSPARPLAWYEGRAAESEGGSPLLRVETERGVMELALFVEDAPLTVDNVITLARRGYFDGQRFHRVVPNFVIQAGDPRGDGSGGPGYAIRDEINRHRYGRGTLGMALSGPNTGGSQFFVTHSPQPHLDGGYTVFGEVVSGFDVLDRIIQGDRIVRVTVR